MRQSERLLRVGLLWRGDRTAAAPTERVVERLGPLLSAFRDLPVVVEHIVYSDEAAPEVRKELLACDGVLVWVNPIQDGQNRAQLDNLLRDAAARGVWVSAHPDTITKLGTKEVLYQARALPWGSDVEVYRSAADFEQRFPARLSKHSEIVVKQARGNGGDGVWKVAVVEPISDPEALQPDTAVLVRDARATDGASTLMPLSQFLTLASECFVWSGSLVDQPFQQRLAEGMLRCYFTRDRLVGFCRQWPRRGLLEPEDAYAATTRPASVMEPAETPRYQALRQEAETRWLPALMAVLGLAPSGLPVIWDADLLFGSTETSRNDNYVLCEINTSAVWPFPPTAARSIAHAALAAITRSRGDARHSE